MANAIMRKFRIFNSGGKNCVEVVNKPSVKVIFAVAGSLGVSGSYGGVEPLVKVINQNGQVSHTWGGSGTMADGSVVSTIEMPFNSGDQLQLHYPSTSGLYLLSIKVKICVDGICKLLDVLTHDGQFINTISYNLFIIFG